MEKEIKVVARNKKAHHNYFILEIYECGIVLKGTEIKSIRNAKVSIQDAYCTVKNEELFIHNMHIAKYDYGNIFNHDEKRDRKLLAHKREIKKLMGKVTLEGLTIIPLELYIKKGYAKIKIALAKGKKQYDKREDLKRKAISREMDRMIKSKRY